MKKNQITTKPNEAKGLIKSIEGKWHINSDISTTKWSGNRQ